LGVNQAGASKSMERLSSGLRINRAGDDAAGLAISEKMRGQIRGLKQASRNAQDGISLIQTAEGALNETHAILQRMRELAVQASNDTTTDADRTEIQKEVDQLRDEIDRIANTTEFNTKKMLDGSLEKASAAKGTKMESVVLDGTATQGTNTADLAIASSVNIVTGVNDQLNLTVDGANAQITIAQGQYSRAELVDAVNSAIGSSALAGTVTAELGSDNKLVLRSASEGSGSTVAVATAAGTNDARHTLGFTDAVTSGTAASNDIASGVGGEDQTTVKLTVGNRIVDDVDLTKYGYSAGEGKFKNDATTRDALQAAFDDTFGAGAVTVEISDNTLTLASDVGNVGVAAGTNNGITGAILASADDFGAGTLTTGDAVDGVDSVETAAASTTLISLGDGKGNNLGLRVGNQVNISVLVGGSESTSTLAVTASTTLNDLATAIRDTIGGAASVSIDGDGKIQVTGQQGEAYSVSNLTLSAQVSASDDTEIAGNFGNVVSAFSETQAASDLKTDRSLSFHIGANEDQTMNVDINEMSVQSLMLSSIDLTTAEGAETATTVINNAIETVSAERSKLGAFQSRLEHSISNLGTSAENLQAAESRIRDLDMAEEMMAFTKNNILQQAATAMLAQANMAPQSVLQLLG
jgi:flagellin